MPSVIGTDDSTPRKGFGVQATSDVGDGVIAFGNNVGVIASTAGQAAVLGNNTASGSGVEGLSATGTGVVGSGGPRGVSGTGTVGVFGNGKNGVQGVSVSPTDSGVWGDNGGAGYGVSGSTNSGAAAGVWGNNSGTGPGVRGTSAGGDGIQGETNSSFQPGAAPTAGVWGNNLGSGPGVKGTSTSGDAVIGVSTSNAHAGVSAVNDSGGYGIWVQGTPVGKPAGHFEGSVEINGQITALGPVGQGQIFIDAASGAIKVASPQTSVELAAAAEPLIELRSQDQKILDISAGGITTPDGFW